MTSPQVRQYFFDFFSSSPRNHVLIPSSPLLPENDPSTLFTSSGMQPLIPYLLGQAHPQGKRLVNSQKCFRSQDIDEVGDGRHTTFFEMLGNWSLGDYFKKEQLPWKFEFLTNKLGLDPRRLYVSVFAGNDFVPKDTESVNIWKEIFAQQGIDAKENERIFAYPASKNWWSRSGEPERMPADEPGGPDSEVFFDFGSELKLHENSKLKDQKCHPNCDCGRFLEIGNSVFMQFQKKADGTLAELPQKNVDFGGGLERLTAAVSNCQDIFKTDLFLPVISILENHSGASYKENSIDMQIIIDHFRASTFLVADGVLPSNKNSGYILRRLIRRAVFKLVKLGIPVLKTIPLICGSIIKTYETVYFSNQLSSKIENEIGLEADRFLSGLRKGNQILISQENIDEKVAFDLFQSHGFPFELTQEIVRQQGKTLDRSKFDMEFQKHQELSRTASSGMFKGGLADQSEIVVKYHTATHLLHQALRDVLGKDARQAGSNITSQRLRFDFTHPDKLSTDQITQVESIINQKITQNLPVSRREMSKSKALSEGTLAFFPERYPEKVSVYTIGAPESWYSKELCGGPHVVSTGEIGHIKIIKEESAGSGIRRIYAKISAL